MLKSPSKIPSSFADTAALIRRKFPAMSPQFQAASRFLLNHSDDVAVSSMRALAARAGVQPPTLVRLAQSLGFDGWPGLRQRFIANLRFGPEPYATRAKSLVKRGETREMMAELVAAQRTNLDHTEAQNRAVLPRAARLLHGARTVHVAGFRACYPIALAFSYVYRLFRASVTLLNGDGGTLEMQLRGIGGDDATVVASFAPYSHEARIVARAARAAGSRVIAMTDSAVAPIALLADETILFSVASPSFFPSIVGAIAATESLLEILVALAGEDAVRRIAAAEKQLFAAGAYEARVPGAKRPSKKQRPRSAARAKVRRDASAT